MTFPHNLSPDLDTRAGRMLAAGRVKVTLTKDTGEHITVLFKVFRDNRDKQFKANGKNWEACTLADATHVFVEVPNQGAWNDKVGTFYPRNGRWYDDRNADPSRVRAAAVIAEWLNDPTFLPSGVESIKEQSECARCGLELTDPVSIARGIGPVCLGKMTGSQHEVKVKQQIEQSGPDMALEVDEQTSRSAATAYERSEAQVAANIALEELDRMSDAALEGLIANASRVLEKRAFARLEADQERAAHEAKAQRDQGFLSR